MEQYIEFIKKAIIEAVENTNDNKLLTLIYGILMNQH